MEPSMPRLNGEDATRRITGELPGIRAISLPLHDEEQDV